MSNVQNIGANNAVLDGLTLHGYVRLPFKIAPDAIESLRCLFERWVGQEQAGKRFSDHKARQVLDVLQHLPDFFSVLEQVLGQEAVITRTLLLRKSGAVNWPLGWHQDVTLTTKVSQDIPSGFGPVSYKDGLPHVTATEQFLAGLLSARIHLDEADRESGALEIIPGSHRRGRIPNCIIEQEVMDDIPSYVPAKAGEIHLFRPLLLHRSGKVTANQVRRVIQLEMSPRAELPEPLEWFETVPLFKGYNF